MLSPRQILERLSQRLDLLRGGRDADARQRTLRATIEWSYELLTEEEKRLFAGLSVFAGGCTVEAAESVCDADLDPLQSLVDKSLLRHTDERFWMLETIRELALERLEIPVAPRISGDGTPRTFSSSASCEAGAAGLELIGLVRPVRSGARQHPSRAWPCAPAGPLRRCITARRHGLRVLVRAGLLERGTALARAGARRMRRSPPTRRRASGRGPARGLAGGRRAGRAVSEELLGLAAEIGSKRARFDGLLIAGIVTDDPDEDVRLHTEAAGVARELGDSGLVAHCVNNIGNVELNRGEYGRALELFQESLAAGRERGKPDLIARASLNLGFTMLLLDDPRGARSLLRDGLSAARELGQVEGFMYGFASLGTAYARDDPARAARLLGRADALCEETASDLDPLEARVRDETNAALRASLGEDAFAALQAEGRAFTLEEALMLALRAD